MTGQDKARRRGTSRRSVLKSVLKGTLIGVPTVLGVAGAGVGGLFLATGQNAVGTVPFVNRLPIPPLQRGTRDAQGRLAFTLRAATAQRQLRGGATTTVWQFSDSSPGPTLRAARGEHVTVAVRNALDVPTSVHWHGMHVPARMDGGPHQPIAAGEDWNPEWTVDQPAASLWYHPHPHGQTAPQIYRGMAGLFIIDDPEGPDGLPSEYGVDDIPLIVRDVKFDGDNRFDPGVNSLVGVGQLGNTILVNGTTGAYLEARTERVRLRLLNASTARTFQFGLADGRPFDVIGSDGGLLPAPTRVTTLQLSPAERAELVVTLKPGERVVLRTYPTADGLDPLNSRFTGGDDLYDVLELRAAAQLRPSPPLPATLAPAPALAAGSPTRRFELAGEQINGKSHDVSRVDFVAKPGAVETWEVVSPFPKPHNFHVHGLSFQVVSIGGVKPPAAFAGWKDTVFLPPAAAVRLAVRLPQYTDDAVPFMFHCHLPYHEDRGMMGQFLVTATGQGPAMIAGHGQ